MTHSGEHAVGQALPADLAEKVRLIRVRVLQMIHDPPEGHPGHPGGSLSAADIVAALYFGILRADPA